MAYRLILADDSITIQKVVELTLSEEDFEVTAYGDGESALEAARRHAPDIILADVIMPRMDGYELCGRVKQDPALQDVPVLLLAGTFENFDETAALRAGADDHITKPFESAELISKVKRLVEARHIQPAEELMTAEPIEELELAEELIEAAPVEEDDLWNVVDMQSEDQPLADATQVLTEEDLWKRANLVAEPGENSGAPGVEEGIISWDDLPAEPVMEAEEAGVYEEAEVYEEADTAEAAFEEDLIAEEIEETGAAYDDDLMSGEVEPFPEVFTHEGPEAEATAVLDMEEIGASVFADYSHDVNVESPGPAVQPAPAAAAVSPEALREEILAAVNSVLDQKIKEALSSISRDVIERVVWDVVPGLAEEIIVREIEKLKAGIK